MAGIETLLVGAAKAMKAGEALNLASMAGKALGIGVKKEESGGGGSQGPDKSIEANRAGGRDEEMYLFLDALFGQLQTADLSNEITSEERRLFGKFLQALTPAEANLVIGGVAKRESDIHIKEPVVLKMRRRNKQGEEQEVDERSFKDFSVKTNARGRSIVRGIAHHITEQVAATHASTSEAILEAENQAVTSLVALLRHAQLVRNAEDIGSELLRKGSEQFTDADIFFSECMAAWLLGKAPYEQIQRDLALQRATYETAEGSDKKRLGKEYLEALYLAVDGALKPQVEHAEPQVETEVSPPLPPKKKRFGRWHYLGIGWTLLIIAIIATAWY
ncbi:MAG: hypothetical protein KA731_02025 [Candidatus Moranbacteria bacterium]|nr:hypothetical protein [Candidatus Moranbacteria bacterium]MBP7696017.1 hypothetical protein [Candidatus Moranbacteria bacterium]